MCVIDVSTSLTRYFISCIHGTVTTNGCAIDLLSNEHFMVEAYRL